MAFNISLNALSRLSVKWPALAIVLKTLLLHSIVACSVIVFQVLAFVALLEGTVK